MRSWSRSMFVVVGLSIVCVLAGASRVLASDDDKDVARPSAGRGERPAQLAPLYISFAALQVLDMHSTKMALGNNARATEGNPLIGGLANSTVGMLAVKTAAAASVVYMNERLWKKNRKAAIFTMIGLNAGYALIVAHNYRIAANGAPAH